MQEIPLPFLKYYIQKNGWFLILFLICEVRNVNILFRYTLELACRFCEELAEGARGDAERSALCAQKHNGALWDFSFQRQNLNPAAVGAAEKLLRDKTDSQAALHQRKNLIGGRNLNIRLKAQSVLRE